MVKWKIIDEFWVDRLVIFVAVNEDGDVGLIPGIIYRKYKSIDEARKETNLIHTLNRWLNNGRSYLPR